MALDKLSLTIPALHGDDLDGRANKVVLSSQDVQVTHVCKGGMHRETQGQVSAVLRSILQCHVLSCSTIMASASFKLDAS